MRISRGSQVIGGWSPDQVKKRLADGHLLLSDSFYDEDASEWLPLSELPAKGAAVKAEKIISPLCYCGTGLPFQVCCGDGKKY